MHQHAFEYPKPGKVEAQHHGRICAAEAGFAIVNAKNSFRITRKTRFLKKAGFSDLSGKNIYHIEILH
jgi:hypothetical protein